MFDPRLLVGYDSSDDACVYSVSDDVAVIETVDFFTPIVDDPYLFGQIAAANALSDVYAMGGVPKLAMNLLCVPSCLPLDTVRAILEGGHDKAVEAGCVIAGGHTIQDDEPKYGLCVTGFVHPQHILKQLSYKVRFIHDLEPCPVFRKQQHQDQHDNSLRAAVDSPQGQFKFHSHQKQFRQLGHKKLRQHIDDHPQHRNRHNPQHRKQLHQNNRNNIHNPQIKIHENEKDTDIRSHCNDNAVQFMHQGILHRR